MRNIYLLVGESGSGKSTIADALESQYALKQLCSYTTRPKRSAAEAGHKFISDGEFDLLEGIAAYTEFCGYRYCATQDQIDEADIYIIDPEGIKSFQEHYKGDKGYKIIYISVPEKNRKQRMYSRGDNKLEAAKRIGDDKESFQGVEKISNECFLNQSLEKCVKAVYSYIQMCEADSMKE